MRHHSFTAMATVWELWLVGDDAGHLDAVAGAVTDEVQRLGARLSRFDPAAEAARVNRDAAGTWVRVDAELFALVADCEDWRGKTGGYFAATPAAPGGVELDAGRRSLRLARPDAALDFGGCAKGYALDRAAELLRGHGVTTALMHGGTSSVLTLGDWPIDIRHPDDANRTLATLRLCDRAASCSASLAPGSSTSDVVNPHTGQPLTAAALCVVLAETGFVAEVLSTAMLAMGRDAARRYAERVAGAAVGWHDAGAAELEWWGDGRE